MPSVAEAVAKKVMIIGLDCAEPSLVLDRWRDRLPVLSGLMERGVSGRLTSIVPPITVPAWSCMMASRTPGDLGVYGFRNRADHTYDGAFIADGSAIKAPRLWDLVGRAGGSSIVVGVPGTYPPRPLRGALVSCFLTPSAESRFTYPPALKAEVEEVVGEYLFDCTNFRTEDKDDLLRQVYEMTDKRFRLADHLLATKPWQLFAFVEMGTDRIHHGFWKHMDPEHRKHEPGGPYEHVIRDYYEHVDGLVGGLLDHADDETLVLVVSDHGAKRLDGGIRVNEWLRTGGPPLAPRGAERRHVAARGRDRLVADDRVGRGRLLRARLPQRRGPRAGGRRLRLPTTRRCATTSQSGSPRSLTTRAGRSRRTSTSPRRSTRRSPASRPT